MILQAHFPGTLVAQVQCPSTLESKVRNNDLTRLAHNGHGYRLPE